MAPKILLILLLVTVTVVLARPRPKQSRHQLRSLLLRKLRQEESNVCVELSAAAGEVMGHFDTIISSTLADVSELSPQLIDTAKELVNRLFGFDFFDDEAREEYTCKVTQATTLSELKNIEDEAGVSYNEFRLEYDAMWAAVKFAVDAGMADVDMPGSEGMWTVIHALESAGLSDLDPQGVEFIRGLVGQVAGSLPSNTDYTPAAPYPGNAKSKCNHLANVLESVAQDIKDANPVQYMISQTYMKMFTGIDIDDNNQVRRLLCNIVDAADQTGSLEAVFRAIDDHGVFSSMYKAVYPFINQYYALGKQQLGMFLQMMEMQLNMIENGGPGGAYGGYDGNYGGGQQNTAYYGDYPNQIPQLGSDYPGSYPGNYPGGPGDYPGHHGGPGGYPGGPGDYPGHHGGPGGYPGDYPGQHGGPENYPSYYTGPDNSGGLSGPGLIHGKAQMAQLVDMLQAVMRFLDKLEETSLLSLTDDL